MLKIGIVIIVLSLLLSSVLPYSKKVERDVKFVRYDQTLSEDTKCYMDVKTISYLGSLERRMASYYSVVVVAYFLVSDSAGEWGILTVDGESDIEKFIADYESSTSTMRCYGTIVEAPDYIMGDLESYVEGTVDYDSTMEEAESMEETLSMYKNMDCEPDMELTELVSVMGPGCILLMLAGVCFVARIIFRQNMLDCQKRIGKNG